METMLLGVEAFTFLEKEGLPVLRCVLAKDAEEAASQARAIGFPVTLKLSSPDVIHKTETGGVRVGLKSENEVREVFQEIVAHFQAENADKRFDGVMVQNQGRGIELIVGTLQDQQFGPVLMFGLGGVAVEALDDVSFRMIPITARDARTMIDDLHGSQVLKNPRGEHIDLAVVNDFLVQISALIERHPEIRTMDLNPVFVSSQGIQICDARIEIGAAGASSL